MARPVGVVHASDKEVLDERIADAVDRALGAGASAGLAHGDGRVSVGSVPASDVESPYQKLFGEGFVGRPLRSEHPTGRPTGDRRITEAARRRATRVLRHIYEHEFERLMALEAAWLEVNGLPGRGGEQEG